MNKTTPESRKLERQVLKWHNEKFDKLTGLKVVKGKLKMFTPEAKETIKLKPEITYKMKKVINSIKKAVLHLNILSLLFLFACGSDNPVNNGSNPPVSNDSLVFSMDSLALYCNGLNTNDTTLFNIFSMNDSIKVSLTAETNCTSQDTGFVAVAVGNISTSVSNFELPNTFNFYGVFPSVSSGVAFSLYLKTTSMRFIRIKNVKLYKVNR